MAPSSKSSKILVAPTRVDGGVSRLVSTASGGSRVETWSDGAWRPGGADVAEVSKGPPASPELLAELGVPADA